MSDDDSKPSLLKHEGEFRWANVPRQEYKSPGDHWRGVSRTELIAEIARAELPFHVRYFEIEPQGYSSREKHAHEHVVIVTRGHGTVDLEGTSKAIEEGDIVHVRSWQTHQFRNTDSTLPLGFYCIVAAERDRPIVEGGSASACELPSRTSALDAGASTSVK